MKNKYNKIAVFCLLLVLFSFDLPKGWIIAGSKPKSYDMGTDIGAGRDGKNCATIQSKKNKIDGFGTLMQKITPEKYLGKRIRMSAYVKTENVVDWCGLWMRCDGFEGKLLAFDNMGSRPIKGTTDWKKYEVVLDISDKTQFIAFGTLLDGTGKVWIDEIIFEIVDSSVPTTQTYSSTPQNLSFDE